MPGVAGAAAAYPNFLALNWRVQLRAAGEAARSYPHADRLTTAGTERPPRPPSEPSADWRPLVPDLGVTARGTLWGGSSVSAEPTGSCPQPLLTR